MKTTPMILALSLALQGCSVLKPATPGSEARFLQAVAADTVSTELALSAVEGAYETNPLGPAGALVMKGAMYGAAKALGGETEQQVYSVGHKLFEGYAVNNVLITLGAATGVAHIGGACYIVWSFFNSEEGKTNDHDH